MPTSTDNYTPKLNWNNPMLTLRPTNSKQSGTYISPSDAILSPASQKLAGFKQRQINKQYVLLPNPRCLFSF